MWRDLPQMSLVSRYRIARGRWDDVVPFIRLNWKDEGDVEGVRDRFRRIRSMDVAQLEGCEGDVEGVRDRFRLEFDPSAFHLPSAVP